MKEERGPGQTNEAKWQPLYEAALEAVDCVDEEGPRDRLKFALAALKEKR